jgi:hypothetical protein
MSHKRWILAILMLFWLGPATARAQDDIKVVNPSKLQASSLPTQRIPLGIPGDYKPCVAVMPDGEVLLVAFRSTKQGEKKFREDILFYRSRDGGQTWSERRVLDNLLGREPYLTVLKDGTIFITVHFLPGDIRNQDGYTYALVHRSADGGKTWTSTRVGPEGFPPKAETLLTRKVLELPDKTLLLGVDYVGGPAYFWRSKDRGVTWTRSEPLKIEGWRSKEDGSMFFGGESVLWRTKSGKILVMDRVSSEEWPIAGRVLPPAQKWDHTDHETVWESSDGGHTFRKTQDLGDYAEMYPSVLRLKDGRLLYTYTVRDLKVPLGVRAVLGRETPDGFTFDFDHDQLILDGKTPKEMPSGGGFGPTVQLKDGTLLTSYSYRLTEDTTNIEVVRWKLPPTQ